MPDIPDTLLRTAEDAIRSRVRLRLGERALAAASAGKAVMLSGREAEEAARAALDAAIPLLADAIAHRIASACPTPDEPHQVPCDYMDAARIAREVFPVPLSSVDDLRGQDVTPEDAEALRHRGGEPCCDAQQALQRVVDLARSLEADQLVAADNIATAILGLAPEAYWPGESMALLNQQRARRRDSA
ncbi:hypothetical protein ABT340_39450 [Streptosporangium sp. NPDC000239]|uniref:hypothetical protein n=1 Tax=Streptosporangium sp. NPDC000239 TaxID=3154248 RepID=UPI0033244BB6